MTSGPIVLNIEDDFMKMPKLFIIWDEELLGNIKMVAEHYEINLSTFKKIDQANVVGLFF